MRKILYLSGFSLLFLCLLPIILALSGLAIANAVGCDISVTSTSHCLILGTDWGETLYTLTMLHWFGLVTLPVAALTVIFILLLALFDLIRYLRR